MSLDFPDTPVPGQNFSGFVWDGTKWTAGGPSATGAVTQITAGTGLGVSPSPIVATGQVSLLVPVTEDHGGTGQTSYTQGDIIYASGPTTLAKLGRNATATRYLANTGPSNNPAWSQVDLASGASGILAVANGGTGSSSVAGAAFLGLSGGTISGSLGVTGNFTLGGSETIGGNLTVSGTMHSSQVIVDGDATIAGTMHSGQAIVDGVLTVSDTINTNAYHLAGVNFAGHGVDGAGALNYICDAGGAAAISMYGVNGTYYRCDNAHTFTNRAATVNLVRFQADGVCQNASGSWSTLSDAGVKENLAPYTAGLSEVLQLNPQSFTYVPGRTTFPVEGQTFYGLVAQEVEPVLPEMVGHTTLADGGEVATLSPTHLVYVLLNAAKELAAKNAELEARLVALEGGSA